MNAVLIPETEVKVDLGPIVVEDGKTYSVLHKGSMTIQIPINNGTIADIHDNMDKFWTELASLPEVIDIFNKYGVIVK